MTTDSRPSLETLKPSLEANDNTLGLPPGESYSFTDVYLAVIAKFDELQARIDALEARK